jgi:predicted metal-binding membrane protein
MANERASGLTFYSALALLFAASAVVTIVWGLSMSAMDGMPMPGGWTMPMTWMPGQDWLSAAVSFLGMWVVMMMAMMMPSLMPMLFRYRQAVGMISGPRLGALTALVGVGYFAVWTVFGIAVFPLGVMLATIEMQQPVLSHAVPISVGVVVFFAGMLQFTPWKAQQLACCRQAGCRRPLPAGAGAALLQGLRFGLHCSQCCFGLMAILLVIGVMDLRAMAVVAAAITIERLAPAGVLMARISGAVAIAAGLFLVARAIGTG